MLPRVLLDALEPVLLLVLVRVWVVDVVRVEELRRLLARVEHASRRQSEHLDDSCQLVVLARPREERQPQKELDGDTAQTPHVDRRGVGHAEQDLGRAVESRLDVRVDRLSFVAGRAKVDDFDLG